MFVLLRLRLRGKPARFAPDVIGGVPASDQHTRDEMLKALRAKLARRGHGIVHLVKDFVLLPQNPFDLNRRRAPRREVVTVGALILLLISAIVIFNLQALEGASH
jgi:hypothetical protein